MPEKPIVTEIAVKNQQTSEYEYADIGSSADKITYDNSSSQLEGGTVQAVIDEVNTKIGNKSTVSVTPTLVSGTQVGTISVNGTGINLYAPTPIDVVANPSASGELDNLQQITIGSTSYNVPQGNSNVEELDNLSDVSISNPSSGDVLTYNGTEWHAAPAQGGGGSSTLSGLSDVDLSSLVDGQILKYDATNQEWINANESTGSTVVWNQIQSTGTKIATVSVDGTPTDVYAPTSGGGGATSLSGLSDVTITSASNGQVLKYDSANQKWINTNESGGTTVIANPSGTATDELSSIQIGNDIYEIVGGGGSSSGYKETALYDGSSASSLQSSVELSDTWDKYDAISLEWIIGGDNSIMSNLYSTSVLAEMVTNSRNYLCTGYTDIYAIFKLNSDKKTFTNIAGNRVNKLLSVKGIKYESGSSDGSGGDILIKDRNWTLITSSFGTTQLTNTYDYYLWIVICNGKIDHYKIIDSSLLDLETNEDSIIEYKSWNDGQGAYSDSRVIITTSSVTLWDNNQEAVSAKLYGANKNSGGGSVSWTDVTGTLTAGQTNLTIENSIISDNATYDFYTSKFGVNPTDIVISEPKIVVLRQELVPQESDLTVTVTANNNWNGFDPWKAFGDSSVSNAGWIGNGGDPHWLQIEFPSETSLLYMDFISRDANRSHAVSRVGYSDDGINFTECGITESTMVNNEGHVELDTDYTAKYFKLYFDGYYSYQAYPMISELLLYGKDTDPTGIRSITLTFEPQQTNLGVKVRIWNNN